MSIRLRHLKLHAAFLLVLGALALRISLARESQDPVASRDAGFGRSPRTNIKIVVTEEKGERAPFNITTCPFAQKCVDYVHMPLDPKSEAWSHVIMLVPSDRIGLRMHFREHQIPKLKEYNIEVMFFIDKQTEELCDEAYIHRDMVFLNKTKQLEDTTQRNNSPDENMLRNLETYEWGLDNRNNFTWMIHSDNDQFWCVENLRRELTHQESLFTAHQPCVHMGNYIFPGNHTDVTWVYNRCALKKFMEKAARQIASGGESLYYPDWVDEFDEVRIVDEKRFTYGSWRSHDKEQTEDVLIHDWQIGWIPYDYLNGPWSHLKSCVCACQISIHVYEKKLKDFVELAELTGAAGFD